MTSSYPETLQMLASQFATPLRITLIISLALFLQHLIQRITPRFRELIASRQESLEGAQRVRTLSGYARCRAYCVTH